MSVRLEHTPPRGPRHSIRRGTPVVPTAVLMILFVPFAVDIAERNTVGKHWRALADAADTGPNQNTEFDISRSRCRIGRPTTEGAAAGSSC